MNTPNFKLCPVCGIWIDSYGRCNCNSRKRVNWNSRFVALVAVILLAVSLMVAQPAKAQTVPQPQPTPSIGEPPHMIHRVFLPYISIEDDGVNGQGRYWGGRQAVSWCPGCNPAAS